MKAIDLLDMAYKEYKKLVGIDSILKRAMEIAKEYGVADGNLFFRGGRVLVVKYLNHSKWKGFAEWLVGREFGFGDVESYVMVSVPELKESMFEEDEHTKERAESVGLKYLGYISNKNTVEEFFELDKNVYFVVRW